MTRQPRVPKQPRAASGSPYDRPRSLRMTDELWGELRRRAEAEGLTASFLLGALAKDYGRGLLHVDERAKTGGEPRSARISDEVWEGLKEQAKAQGIPPTRALTTLAEQFVQGRIAVLVHIATSQLPSSKPAESIEADG